jgi:hypothetical protein
MPAIGAQLAGGDDCQQPGPAAGLQCLPGGHGPEQRGRGHDDDCEDGAASAGPPG